ncbi:TolC family protein [Vibrio neonatus]|uniref:TolC family protein n=1 Tax=Vibrio neonatus TaxID=278860 RepID=UPI0021C30035|nr:TolC family protein [Vibrio neonatus]
MFIKRSIAGSLLGALLISTSVSASSELNRLIEQALDADKNRMQFSAQSRAMQEQGIASSSLMDPKLKFGVGGLPVDSFRFDEDPMTNISVGLMQQFERGASQSLKQKKSNQQAEGAQFQIRARELEVAKAMTTLWLELGYLQFMQENLKENHQLQAQLLRYMESNYSLGNIDTQDLLDAELSLSKLDDKLQANTQNQQRIQYQLSEWLGDEWLQQQHQLQAANNLNWPNVDNKLSGSTGVKHYPLLQGHPMVQLSETQIKTNQIEVDISEEAYAPQFGVEVMYAYRQADNMRGEPASDLLSAYVTVDIPLFTGNRQDRVSNAAQHKLGASRLQKDLLLQQLNAKLNTLIVEKDNFEQRIERYEGALLPRSKERVDAVNRGYDNNTLAFEQVIKAQAEDLSLHLEYERLITDLNLTISDIAYLINGYGYQVSAPTYSTAQSHGANSQESKK